MFLLICCAEGTGVGEECTCEKAAKPVTAVYDNISTFFSVKALSTFDQSLQHFNILKCDTTGYHKRRPLDNFQPCL